MRRSTPRDSGVAAVRGLVAPARWKASTMCFSLTTMAATAVAPMSSGRAPLRRFDRLRVQLYHRVGLLRRVVRRRGSHELPVLQPEHAVQQRDLHAFPPDALKAARL